MSWTLDGRILRRVLVSRQRYLGDLVMATVVPRLLKAGDADLEIGFLCEAGHGAVLANQSDIDELILLERERGGMDARARGATETGPDRSRSDGPRVLRARGSRELHSVLRGLHYDLVVDLFFNPYSAWLFRLAGIRGRIGGTSKWRRRLYTHTVQRSDPQIAASGLEDLVPGGLGEHVCRLAPLVHGPTGVPFLEWLAREYVGETIVPRLDPAPPEAESRSALDSLRLSPQADPPPGQRPYLVLAPGATWPAKEWPAASWRELIRRICGETPYGVALLSPPVRRQQWSALADSVPAGRGGVLPSLQLAEVLDVLAGARGVVSVDGGVMHAAVGLGRPTVGLFGPTDPEIWFPYEAGGPYRVLATRPHCHPCDLHECNEFICLPELEHGIVFEAFLEVLARDGAAR